MTQFTGRLAEKQRQDEVTASSVEKEWRAITDPSQNAERVMTPEEKQADAERRRQAIREDTQRNREEQRLKAERKRDEEAATKARQVDAIAKKHASFESFHGKFLPEYEPSLNKPMLNKLRVGLDGIIKSEAFGLEDAIAQWHVGYEARAQWSPSAYRAMRDQAMAYNQQARADGFSDVTRTIPVEGDWQKQASMERSLISGEQKKLYAERIAPAALKVAQALQDAARSMATERLKSEETEAAEFGIPFHPSPLLQTLVYFGIHLVRIMQQDHLSSYMGDPKEILFGILDLNNSAARV